VLQARFILSGIEPVREAVILLPANSSKRRSGKPVFVTRSFDIRVTSREIE